LLSFVILRGGADLASSLSTEDINFIKGDEAESELSSLPFVLFKDRAIMRDGRRLS
jgi:hypothetical protein